VLDGELLILGDDGHEEFDALQNRLHPAESRVRMLAEKTPALLRAFDPWRRGRRSCLRSPSSNAASASNRWSPAWAGGERRQPGRLSSLPCKPAWPRRRPGSRTARGSSPRSSRRPTGPASARGWSR
jgi:hypothetical protein